jgi:hypothetical protein
VAPRVTTRRASCGGTASRSRCDAKLCAAARAFLAAPLQRPLRTPLKSTCRALRIPLSGRAPWVCCHAQDQVTRMLCPPLRSDMELSEILPGRKHAG